MISVLGKLTFDDIGPGKYELVTPTLTYNLSFKPDRRDEVAKVFATCGDTQVRVRGQKLGSVATIGGTNKQTILLESIELG